MQNLDKLRRRNGKILKSFSFSDILKEYNRHLKLEKNQSLYTRASKLERLNFFFNKTGMQPDEVTREDILNFLENKGGCVATLNSYKQAFWCFFSWIGKGDIVNDIELAKREKLKDHPVINQEEYEKMIAVTREYEAPDVQIQRNITMLSFLWHCGMRVGELLQIKKQDVTFDNLGIKILLHNEKIPGTRYNRILSYDCNTMLDIKEYFAERDWERKHVFVPVRTDSETMSSEAVNQILKNCAEKAGIGKRVHSHLFRHTKASRMAKEQFNEEYMRRWFGWTDGSKMPSHYSHLVQKDVDEVLLKRKGMMDVDNPQASVSRFT